MHLNATYAATVYVTHYDGGLDMDITTPVVLPGVSWHGPMGANPGIGGLQRTGRYRLRVFLDNPSIGAIFGQLDAVPFQLGDRVDCNGYSGAILSVTDNRGDRRHPHWLVEVG